MLHGCTCVTRDVAWSDVWVLHVLPHVDALAVSALRCSTCARFSDTTLEEFSFHLLDVLIFLFIKKIIAKFDILDKKNTFFNFIKN